MRRHLLVTASALLALAGCTSGTGSDEASEPSSTTSSSSSASPAVPSGPDCAAVWTAGTVLPADYTTCVTDGAAGAQDDLACADGSTLVVYDDRLYAVTGQEILEPADAPLQDTEEFGTAYAACTGE